MRLITLLESMLALEAEQSITAKAAAEAGLFNGGKGRWYNAPPGDPNRQFVAVSQGGELVWIDDVDTKPAGGKTITRAQAMGKPTNVPTFDDAGQPSSTTTAPTPLAPVSMIDSDVYRKSLGKKMAAGSQSAKEKLEKLAQMDSEYNTRADTVAQQADMRQAHVKSKYANKYPSPQI